MTAAAAWELAKAVFAVLRNPWVLLLIAVAAGAAGTGWYRMRYHNEQIARAADNEAAERAALEQIKRDKQKRAEVDAKYQADRARDRQEASDREQAIRAAAGGAISPARRAYYDSVRREQNAAGGGQTRSGGTGRPQSVP